MENDAIHPLDRLLDGTMVKDWPDCVMPGCTAKCCVRLGSPFCYPHSNRPVDMAVKQLDDILDGVREPVIEGTNV